MLPKRFLSDRYDFFELLEEYYYARGWNSEGEPEEKTLKNLSLQRI